MAVNRREQERERELEKKRERELALSRTLSKWIPSKLIEFDSLMDVLPLQQLKANSYSTLHKLGTSKEGKKWRRNEEEARNWNEKLLHNLGEYTYILHASLASPTGVGEGEVEWGRVSGEGKRVRQLWPTQKFHSILLQFVRNASAKSNSRVHTSTTSAPRVPWKYLIWQLFKYCSL